MDVAADQALLECLRAGVLCNESRLVQEEDRWRPEGDPTEVALLVAGAKGGLDPEGLRVAWPALDAIPFESARQFMATLHAGSEGNPRAYLKGAFEVLVPRCDVCLDSTGQLRPFSREALQQQAEALAGQGLRVLALAMKPLGPGQHSLHPEEVESELVFLGLQAMIDPPRPEAIAAVAACQEAGIQVKMITGDHALTARTIAQQLGIAPAGARVRTGAELEQVPAAALPGVANDTHVFARVAPEQKLRLVQALQSLEHVVAMTGDGVNDAPALKQADIGVAMGITGTEVAKDAADMVLTDDNFASIEAAVEEGRGVYDNLRQFIAWTLPTNGGEGLLILIAIALGVAVPVLPVQVLWINLTTAVALGTMLAFEPKQPGLMQQPARDPREPLITAPVVWRIGYLAALMAAGAYGLFAWELAQGYALEAARTSVANVVVLVELLYLHNSRSLTLAPTQIGLFSNRWVIIGSSIMVALQLLFVYLPVCNHLFQTAPVPALAWLEASAVALLAFGVVETEKWVRRRSEARLRSRARVG